MGRYLLERIAYSGLVVLGVVIVVFAIMRLTGDPTPLLLPIGFTQEDLQRVRREMELDQPLHAQLRSYMTKVMRGNFGKSLRHHDSAMALVIERMPATLWLTAAAMAVTVLVALPLGIVAALRRDSLVDVAASAVALTGQSMPTFWLGIIFILIFGLKLGWLPTSGSGSVRHLVLPSIALGAFSAGLTTRLVRSSLLEVLSQQYVRTARSKGLAERLVILKHALRNAAIPVVTVVGLQLGTLLGGAIVTETVFGYPGMARLAVEAVFYRDFPVVQAFVVITAIIMVTINLVVDLCYVVLDPRITYA
ncbi:MAG: ABC transporter permease [Armatimonadetes bacterium]|nr:ABC transporter permease [Armatimonadota bacterium]